MFVIPTYPQQRGRYRAKYTEELISSAVFKVRQKEMSINRASVFYGIPRATIRYRLKKKHQKVFRSGPKTILTAEEEAELEQWVLDSQSCGWPVTKDDVADSVKYFLDKNPRINTFHENRPGKT